MGYYIKMKDQVDMRRIVNEFMSESCSGAIQNDKTQNLMREFYVYADKIIKGVIHSPLYKYYQFAELDDLVNEGRIAIYESILKNQWDSTRGTSFFSFLSTVVSRNLLTYTLKMNRYRKHCADQDIYELNEGLEGLSYNAHLDHKFIANDVFAQIRLFFKGREKFHDLTNLLEVFYYNNIGKKFVKKEFIEFAKSYTFSPSLINTFFNHLKHIKEAKELIFIN